MLQALLEDLTALPNTAWLDFKGRTSKGNKERGRERKERANWRGSGGRRGST